MPKATSPSSTAQAPARATMTVPNLVSITSPGMPEPKACQKSVPAPTAPWKMIASSDATQSGPRDRQHQLPELPRRLRCSDPVGSRSRAQDEEHPDDRADRQRDRQIADPAGEPEADLGHLPGFVLGQQFRDRLALDESRFALVGLPTVKVMPPETGMAVSRNRHGRSRCRDRRAGRAAERPRPNPRCLRAFEAFRLNLVPAGVKNPDGPE